MRCKFFKSHENEGFDFRKLRTYKCIFNLFILVLIFSILYPVYEKNVIITTQNFITLLLIVLPVLLTIHISIKLLFIPMLSNHNNKKTTYTVSSLNDSFSMIIVVIAFAIYYVFLDRKPAAVEFDKLFFSRLLLLLPYLSITSFITLMILFIPPRNHPVNRLRSN